MPAITNDQITAGPATGTACPRTKKMPVPMVAPTPNMESWKSPIVRASSLWPESVPVSSDISVTGLRRNSCCANDAMIPSRPRRAPGEESAPAFLESGTARAVLGIAPRAEDPVPTQGKTVSAHRVNARYPACRKQPYTSFPDRCHDGQISPPRQKGTLMTRPRARALSLAVALTGAMLSIPAASATGQSTTGRARPSAVPADRHRPDRGGWHRPRLRPDPRQGQGRRDQRQPGPVRVSPRQRGHPAQGRQGQHARAP